MIHHRDTEVQSKLLHEKLTEGIIGAAIEVHRTLGAGPLESAYEECVCHELHLRRMRFERQVPLPVSYKGVQLDCGYHLDVVIEDRVILESKWAEHILPAHEAQILTYLKLTVKRVGPIINLKCSCANAPQNCSKGTLKGLRVSVSPW